MADAPDIQTLIALCRFLVEKCDRLEARVEAGGLGDCGVYVRSLGPFVSD
jgi:hypothetical protein